MMLQSDQEDLKRVITEAVTSVCRDRLLCKTHFSVEGLLGITIDQQQVVLVNINEKVASCPNPLVVSTVNGGFTTVNGGLTTPDTSPKVQVNGSLLCNLVNQSPLLVVPPSQQAKSESHSLPNSPKNYPQQHIFSQTVLDGNLRLGDLMLKNSLGKHKPVVNPFVLPQTTEPVAKKRQIEERVVPETHPQPPVTTVTGVVPILDNVVVKKEVVSEDDDDLFTTSQITANRKASGGTAIGLDFEGATCNVNTPSKELRKLVKSDKMWNTSSPSLATISSNVATVNMNGALVAHNTQPQLEYSDVGGQNVKEEDEDDWDTASYLSGGGPYDENTDLEGEEFFKLARSILLYKGTFVTVHSYCKVSRRTGKNTSLKMSSDRACWVMQKMNVPAWDEKYMGEYKELAKGTKVFFKCPPDMVNPVALQHYRIPHQAYAESFYEESRSASFPTKTELLRRILEASPY